MSHNQRLTTQVLISDDQSLVCFILTNTADFMYM